LWPWLPKGFGVSHQRLPHIAANPGRGKEEDCGVAIDGLHQGVCHRFTSESMAERATWLGNDETHYIRKWEDKDLQDMKRLITLTTYWIMSDQLTKAAVVAMPQGKK
jgi:hypothetical protein